MNNRLGYLPLQATVDAGIMCCSPEGAGFECAFDEIRLMQ
jgi:regulation of enolase protein 1 (concanavalin A-like superfamily)